MVQNPEFITFRTNLVYYCTKILALLKIQLKNSLEKKRFDSKKAKIPSKQLYAIINDVSKMWAVIQH